MVHIMKIQERISQRRRFLNITQERLARLVGVSLKTVSRWESGERMPKGEDLRELAASLETSAAYLLGETDNPSRLEMDVLNATTPEENINTRLDRAANATPLNPHHMTLVKVLPKDFRACCGKGVQWLDETVEFESMINMPDPDLVRYSPVIATWAEGNSMEPDIQDGDMVIFTDNIYERELAGNGDIVVVNYNGRMIIRGLITRGGKISLRAFN